MSFPNILIQLLTYEIHHYCLLGQILAMTSVIIFLNYFSVIILLR